ncbi:MAG: DNA mismatch endonuclease Vsr [Bacteroidales bacterium]|nr:DNA mismatch endonuclease Vsr [Bacteroidales bacterium]
MTDVLTPEQRHRCMQANRGRGTTIEIIFAEELRRRNIHYRKNDRSVKGKPDFCFKGLKIAVFCDGVFWHGKDWDSRSKENLSDYWISKIERNIARDKQIDDFLFSQGWTVLRFWEDAIRKDVKTCVDALERCIAEKTTQRIRRTYAYDNQYESQLMAAEVESYYNLTES